jgi:hypothetical protein
MDNENELILNKHILIATDTMNDDEFTFIKNNFCGITINILDIQNMEYDTNTLFYLTGDVYECSQYITDIPQCNIYVITDYSHNYDNTLYTLIDAGHVPINIHNVGIMFRCMFDNDDIYHSVTAEHEFQDLGIGNVPGKAYRKGIYITDVTKEDDALKFKLLRCSTNLSGPTDNFRDTDRYIIDNINGTLSKFYTKSFDLNHVLAQTYHNKNVGDKQRKARIAVHSDKTKDMANTAIMVFCTFYDDLNINGIKRKDYDYKYNNTSALTRLRFKLKSDVDDDTLVKSFDIVLYPNSVFTIPLKTNRLYTHEIVPSILPINMLPTRLGYVIRCSNTNAIHTNSQTYIVYNGEARELEPIDDEGLMLLKDMYYTQNKTSEHVDYENKFYFSMNSGDYKKPIE